MYVREVSIDSFQDVGIPLHNNYKYDHHDTDTMVTKKMVHLVIIKSQNQNLPSKNHLYCNKVEASTYPNGEACNWTKYYSSATADITILRENV